MKKFIIFALVTILAAMLFVACDSDVKVDNNTAYTEILESDGAFVVNGKGYDSLQDAIDAAVGAKGMEYPKVTLTKDVTSRGASIGKECKVKIDLNGYTLTFTDVEDNALFVGEQGALHLVNGKVALFDNKEALVVVAADEDAYSIHITNATVEAAAGQCAIASASEFTVYVEDSVVNGTISLNKAKIDIEGSKVNGIIAALDSKVEFGKDTVYAGELYALDSTADVKEGAQIEGTVAAVGGTVYLKKGSVFDGKLFVEGEAVVTSETDSNYSEITVYDGTYNEKGSKGLSYACIAIEGTEETAATINVDDESKVKIVSVPEDDNKKWDIVCSGEKKAEIIADSDVVIPTDHFETGFCYVVIGEEKRYTGNLSEAIDWAVANSTAVVYARNHSVEATETISKTVTIDLNKNTEANDLKIAEGVTLTLTNGNIEGVISGEGTLVVDKADVKKTVEVGALTAKNGSEFNSSVTTSGAQTYNDTIFNPTSESAALTSEGNAITIVNGLFNPYINTTYKYDITATGAANDVSTPVLTITKSVGDIGKIRTTAGAIKIDGSNATSILNIEKISAWNGETGSSEVCYDVTIKGNSEYKVTVTSIDYADDVKTTYAAVTGNIGSSTNKVKSLDDGSSTAAGHSSFSGAVYTVGNQNYYGSVFDTADLFAGVTINILNATGSITAINNTTVVIDNSTLTGDKTLSVETINAKDEDYYYDVTIKGNSTNKVSVTNLENAKDVKSSYVDFTGDIGEGGHIENITDENSTFRSWVFSSGLLSFNGSTFGIPNTLPAPSYSKVQTSYVNETSTADVNVINMVGVTFLNGNGATSVHATGTTTGVYTSNTMSIYIQDATGVSGSITADDGNIVIDNDNGTSTTGNFATGTLFATNLVTLEGHTTSEEAESGHLVIIGEVHAGSLHSQKTIFNGTIIVFGAVVDGDVSDNTGSTFKSNVSSGGTASFVGSTFDASEGVFTVDASDGVAMNEVIFNPHKEGTEVVGVSVSSLSGNITITKGLGTVWGITANSHDVTVNNSEYTGAGNLITRTISAGDDVRIKGSKEVQPVIGSVIIADVVYSSYAQFGSINANSVQDGAWEEGLAGCSTFNGDVTTSGSMTFNDSVFSGSPDLTSNNAGAISLKNCTGSVGSIKSRGISTSEGGVGTVTINNSASTGILYAGTVTSFYDVGTEGYQYGETCGAINITSPNSTGKLIFGNTGEVRSEYKIIGRITLKDGASYTANTLFLYGGLGCEIDGSELNVYGGQYGDAGDSFMIESYGAHTTTAIHGGKFFSNEEQMLRFFSSHVHYATSLDVEFKLGPSFVSTGEQTTLLGNLVVGKYTDDGSRVNYNKKITFSSSDSGERILTANYTGGSSPASYAIYVYAGTVTFNHVSFTNNSNDEFITLHYCSTERGNYTFVDANVRKGAIKQDL